jgi:NAD(P)H-flavin reductase
VVRPRDGFTKRLLAYTNKHAAAHLDQRVPVRALIEGPYGLAWSLDSYGSVLLIAGGVGITHHLGYVRHLIQGYSERTVAARQVTLIWVVRREGDKDCVGKWMNDILKMEGRKEVFRLEIWVTRGTVFESRSPSNSVIVRRGRPHLSHIVSREAERRLGCMAVSVCGPGGLQDDARKAVRQSIKDGRNVEFVGEAFGW